MSMQSAVVPSPSEGEVLIGPIQPDFTQLSRHSTPDEVLLYGAFLSIKNSLEDGSPVLPSRGHVYAAHEEGIGCSMQTISKVLGSLGNLQEGLGFVMPSTLKKWEEQDWLDNGTWVTQMAGSPEHPAIPTKELIIQASALNLMPAKNRIVGEFGSLGAYQDKLGFVSPDTLERWTEQDWIDNGVWLSHMLGSPEAPVMPTKSSLVQASAARIAPSVDMIRERFGSLPDYQKALGFTPKEPLFDYSGWTRSDYVDNGIWLSHMLGSPEAPVMPGVKDIIAYSKLGLCPPITSTLGGFRGNIEKYQDALGFVNDETLKRWTDQDWIDNGKWLSHAAGSTKEPAYVGRRLLREARQLNLAPSEEDIREHFQQPLSHYQELIGLTPDQSVAARRRGDRAVLIEAFELLRDSGAPRIETKHIHNARALTRTIVKGRFGDLTNLNARLGLADPREWGEDEYVAHGVKHMLNNDGAMLPLEEFTALRRVRRMDNPYNPGEYRGYVTKVREGFQAFELLKADLVSHHGVDESLIPVITQDFSKIENYRETCLKRSEELNGLMSQGVGVKVLAEMFKRSRTTLLWERDDYLYFGKQLYASAETRNKAAMVSSFQTLDKYGLTPFVADIDDVFGSLDNFIMALFKPSDTQPKKRRSGGVRSNLNRQILKI